MEIILNEKNFTKVESILEEYQKGCKARCITAQDIYDEANRIFKAVGISKKALSGCRFECDIHGQSFPQAYRYAPYSTTFTLLYKNGSFRLVDIGRNFTHYSSAAIAHYTDEAKEAILEKYSKV